MKENDIIDPTELVYVCNDDEYSFSSEVRILGTFTSRGALGEYLIQMLEEKAESINDRYKPDGLYLRKTIINPQRCKEEKA